MLNAVSDFYDETRHQMAAVLLSSSRCCLVLMAIIVAGMLLAFSCPSPGHLGASGPREVTPVSQAPHRAADAAEALASASEEEAARELAGRTASSTWTSVLRPDPRS